MVERNKTRQPPHVFKSPRALHKKVLSGEAKRPIVEKQLSTRPELGYNPLEFMPTEISIANEPKLLAFIELDFTTHA